MNKPAQSEYNPYFQHYISLVGEGDFWKLFNKNTADTVAFFKSLPFEKHHYQYAPGKWTLKEVLMHIIDTERVFAYRTLVCARGDQQTPLHSMDDNLYAANIDVSNKPMEKLVEEFEVVRKNSVLLFENITEEKSQLTGNGITHPFTARALGYIMMGHIEHHINIVRERYL